MTQLTEHYAAGFAFAESSVDRTVGLIRNVSLLGRVSKNNRTYSSNAMQEAAKLHKGAGVYLDHPTHREEREREGVRSVRDLAGHVVSARVVGDRVRGDVKVISGTPNGEFLIAIAEQAPTSAGFSHRASGTSRHDDGQEVVEHVSAVAGLDLVTEPATVAGLFESIRERGKTMNDKTEGTLSLEQLRRDHPAAVEAILTEVKEHVELIDAKLKAAGLPERTVTKQFRERLMKAADEGTLDVLIGDRVKLWRQMLREARRERGGPPRSVERDPDLTNGDGTRPVDGAALEEAYKMWHGPSSGATISPEDLARAADTFNYGEHWKRRITPEDVAKGFDLF